jgi:hypothetical protein
MLAMPKIATGANNASEQCKGEIMRKTLLATATAVSLVTLSVSGAFAAPVSGAAINDTASAASLTQKVWWHGGWHHHWHGYGWRHCWWRYGYRHCW